MTATHAPSYYSATATEVPDRPELNGHVQTDVCVVGGGYTGLNAALTLAQKGYRVVLLEAQKIGWGASGRNGGQLHSGQRREQEWLESKLGLGRAKALWKLAEDAKHHVKSLIRDHDIACDWQDGLIHAMHKKRYVAEERASIDHMQQVYGYEALTPLDRQQLSDAIGTDTYYGGSRDGEAGHLHPLNFALGIARAAEQAGANLHENSAVIKIEQGKQSTVKTATASVTADAVVLAGNGYMQGLNATMDSCVMPINNFIATTAPLSEDQAHSLIPGNEAVSDSRFVIYYWRLTADRRLLFGGGETYSRTFPGDIAAFVRPHILKTYPQLNNLSIEHAWGGTLAVTSNRMPFLQRQTSSIYTAAGFSGHGVAIATMAGHCIAEAIAGDQEKFDLFATVPTVRFPGGVLLRAPILALAMTWFAIRDRL
ncbi:MAG: FAD-binding oxidoreductase [Stappiaceae bacterium]